jgi:peptidoglycan/xylan/chitin deacetylase (PgdA/CDA1 family)
MRAILMYHSVDDSGSPISVSPETFRSHQRWLTAGTVRVLPLDDLVTLPPEGGDAVAVTFDDGILNTREPIHALLGEGLPVTIFVVTGQVGGDNNWGGRSARGIPTLPLLGWTDLERLAARGAAVAAHTRTHSALTTLSDQELDDELLGSREALTQRLGDGGAHFAYPYGDVDDRVAARTSQYYDWGHTTEFRLLTGTEPPLRLPRLDMYYFRAPQALDAWGSARFRRHLLWCQARRTLRSRLPGIRARRSRATVRLAACLAASAD